MILKNRIVENKMEVEHVFNDLSERLKAKKWTINAFAKLYKTAIDTTRGISSTVVRLSIQHILLLDIEYTLTPSNHGIIGSVLRDIILHSKKIKLDDFNVERFTKENAENLKCVIRDNSTKEERSTSIIFVNADFEAGEVLSDSDTHDIKEGDDHVGATEIENVPQTKLINGTNNQKQPLRFLPFGQSQYFVHKISFSEKAKLIMDDRKDEDLKEISEFSVESLKNYKLLFQMYAISVYAVGLQCAKNWNKVCKLVAEQLIDWWDLSGVPYAGRDGMLHYFENFMDIESRNEVSAGEKLQKRKELLKNMYKELLEKIINTAASVDFPISSPFALHEFCKNTVFICERIVTKQNEKKQFESTKMPEKQDLTDTTVEQISTENITRLQDSAFDEIYNERLNTSDRSDDNNMSIQLESTKLPGGKDFLHSNIDELDDIDKM